MSAGDEGNDRPSLDGISKLYGDSLAEHGEASLGVGWRDEASHRLRFDQLLQVIEDRAEPFSLNDLGCGLGALLGHLRSGRYAVDGYCGFDINQAMVEGARARYPDATFVQSAELDRDADYGIACGIFNVRLDHSEEAWRGHVLETLAALAARSRRGFAFNLLTSYVDYREDHLFYGDPCFFFDHCKRQFSRRVSLLHATDLWEWTILVRT